MCKSKEKSNDQFEKRKMSHYILQYGQSIITGRYKNKESIIANSRDILDYEILFMKSYSS